jgi:hypothetical protein
VNEIKLSLLSLFLFIAWVAAAEGWVRAVAIVYPGVVALRLARRGRS